MADILRIPGLRKRRDQLVHHNLDRCTRVAERDFSGLAIEISRCNIPLLAFAAIHRQLDGFPIPRDERFRSGAARPAQNTRRREDRADCESDTRPRVHRLSPAHLDEAHPRPRRRSTASAGCRRFASGVRRPGPWKAEGTRGRLALPGWHCWRSGSKSAPRPHSQTWAGPKPCRRSQARRRGRGADNVSGRSCDSVTPHPGADCATGISLANNRTGILEFSADHSHPVAFSCAENRVASGLLFPRRPFSTGIFVSITSARGIPSVV